MKIKELLAGGMLTYELTNIPRPQQRNRESSKSSGLSNKNEDKLLSEDIIKQLMGKGLSNDVDAYLKLLGKISMSSISPGLAEQFLIKQASSVNQILLNKEILQQAVVSAEQANGLNEIAITTTGQILVENIKTGSIDQVSAALLKDNREILRPLTNSELVHRRQVDPSLAFNTSIASVVKNGIGPDKISDYILGIAAKIGQSKLTSEGYVNKKEENIAEGLLMLLEGGEENVHRVATSLEGGEDGVYKVTTSKTNKSSQINQALQYIYTVLPLNMRNFLRASAAMLGMDPEKGAAQLIQTMITSLMSTTSETHVDFDGTQSKLVNGTGGGEGGDKEGVNINQSLLILSGRGTPMTYQLNTGTDYAMNVESIFYLTPTDKSNNLPINKSMTLQDLFTKTSVAGTINPGSVFIGDKRISESEFGRVVYNNLGGFITTYLPYKLDEEGNKIVDFAILDELSSIEDEIKSLGAHAAEADKKRVYREHNLSEYYSSYEEEPRRVNSRVIAPFLAFNGITSNENEYGIKGFKPNDGKLKLLDVNNPRLQATQASIYEKAVSETLDGKEKVDITGVFDYYHSWGGGDIIAGTVYTPLTEDQISAYSANNTARIPKPHAQVDRLIRNQTRLGKSLNNTTTNSLD